MASVVSSLLVDKLNEPLPQEAIAAHPTKKFLSTIKTIYQIERLNQVFGIGGWSAKSEIIENGASMVILKVTLKVPEYGIDLEQYGGNDNPDRGDAYKGAYTDALSKICGYMGIGIDVYKGHGPTASNPNGKPQPNWREERDRKGQEAKDRMAKAAAAQVEEPHYEDVPEEPGLEPEHAEQLAASVALAHRQRFRAVYDRYNKLGKHMRYHAQIKSFGVKVFSDFDLSTKAGKGLADRCFVAMSRDIEDLEEQLKPKATDIADEVPF